MFAFGLAIKKLGAALGERAVGHAAREKGALWRRLRGGCARRRAARERTDEAMRQLMSKRLRQWQAKAKGQKARDVIHGHLARYNLIGLLDWWYKSSKAWRRKQELIARGLPGTVRHTLRTKWKTWQAQASDGNDVEFRAEERAMVLRHFESRAVFGAVRTWLTENESRPTCGLTPA